MTSEYLYLLENLTFSITNVQSYIVYNSSTQKFVYIFKNLIENFFCKIMILKN